MSQDSPLSSAECAQVFEQRALPDPANRNLDRSYHLAMSHRGMGAVEKVPLLGHIKDASRYPGLDM